jgi:RNA polymerase sigma factor (sigma-70 family)
MASRDELEALLLRNLPSVERIAAALCRRHGMRDADAADFTSWVKLKLVEHDYAVLAKFRGESALTTYLTVVIAMLSRDFRVQRWGRWRPSAAAERRGRVAVQLETLVCRDGLRLDQAAQVMRTRGDTALSDRDLAKIFATLPRRMPLRPREVGVAPLEAVASSDSVAADEVDRDRVHQVLASSMDTLPATDQVILRMRFWEGMSIADIARALHLDQKPLYRRIDSALAELRRRVEASGVSAEEARSLLAELES